MRTSGYIMEINLEKLSWAYANVPKFTPLPKFAEEKRDLALIMNKELTNGEVEKCIKEACAYITDVKLFDVYEGEQVGAGKKSLAYSLTLRAADATLTDAEIDKIMDKVLRALQTEFEASLRM